MSEERKMILNMLKEGKITDEEALKLLDAIGEKNNKNFSKDAESSFEKTTYNFVGKVLNSVEKALNKAGETINNIDFDLTNISFDEIKYNKTITKNLKIDNTDEEINLYINNKNGEIKVIESNNEDLEIISTINYDETKYNEDSKFFIHEVEGNNHYYGIDNEKDTNGYVSKVLVKVPVDMIDNLKVVNKNYKIKIEDVNINNIDLKTTNGKIDISNIDSNSLVSKTTNGRVEVLDSSIEDLEVNTTNGKIVISNLGSESIVATNTNGSIYTNNIYDNIKNIKLKSTNGGIYIENINLDRSIIATIFGRNSENISNKFTQINRSNDSTVAKTSLFDEESDNTLEISASTSNGKVSII